MAERSEAEIIESYPIGDQLNAWHDSFNSICVELSISASEAVQHVVNTGTNIAGQQGYY